MIFSARTLRGTLLASLMLVCSASVQAQEISSGHLAAARSAIGAIQATEQFDNILLNAATQIKAELIVNNPNLQGEISTMVDDKAIELAARRGDLENEVARVYAKLFTEQELNEIAAFYQTDAGKKLLSQGPVATREMMSAADVWANGIMRDLRTSAGEGMRQIVAANAPAGAAEGGVAAPTTGAAASN
ncbi:DUF2059 domain-containing protein [Antarcticirhabdus aurantiaca]|uniref:DUF2059 domain-containing protein n=1 Tax=Antarcticirhabdus aurantiaca TaxID=2606717 RepID=A0ACD4NUT9_9HYPH|nr:DUF2059 domain-containing protein [Antarcticirhabdus aurantiaca]WAJ30652.1 DUF2059 domain-containing protein [Jeongeuplla avenae]